ncbi:MAG: hypothetical protein M0P61_09475 [Ignavibacteriaceae bacterium]|nr:hypothetical protein [Ignavibacteriaceae bacterium]
MAEKFNGIPVSRTKLFTIASTAYKIKKGLEKLAAAGLTAEYFEEFAANIEIAKNFKTADQVLKENAEKLAQVKKKCEECYDWLKKVQVALKRTFKGDSPQVKEFPANLSPAKEDAAKMINLLPAAFTIIDKYNTELIAKRAPANLKQKGETLKAELETISAEYNLMDGSSESYTVNRQLAHKKLQDTINEINETGREEYKDDPVTLKLFDSPWPQSKGKEKEPPQEPPVGQ